MYILIPSVAVDSFEPKTMVTRKLRRRHYEPLPMPDKRRKLAPLSSLVYVLDEQEVDDDLKVIFKVNTPPPSVRLVELPEFIVYCI